MRVETGLVAGDSDRVEPLAGPREAPVDDRVTGYGEGAPSGKSVRRSSVFVRLPEDKDWPDIRRIVRAQHQRTVFAHIPFSERKIEAIMERAKQPAIHECGLVAEAKGRLVGLAWFSAGEYLLGESGVMTTVHLLAVDVDNCGPYLAAKTFMRLLTGVRLWSDTRKAEHVLVHVTTGTAIKETDRLLRAAGGRLLGGGYMLDSRFIAATGSRSE